QTQRPRESRRNQKTKRRIKKKERPRKLPKRLTSCWMSLTGMPEWWCLTRLRVVRK
ncbi:unnamed protein product, partial [Symbiodinium pilosum]